MAIHYLWYSFQTNLPVNLTRMQLEDGQVAEARKTIALLETRGFPKPLVDYLTARAEYADGNWQQAVDLLSKARTKAADAPDLAKEIDLWLGRCYQKQGKSDGEIQAYRRAIAIDPQYTAARLMLAEALARQGHEDQSLEQYRAAMGATPDVALQAARIAVQ